MPITFEFASDDPRIIPAATLTVVCPHHEDEVLGAWSVSAMDPRNPWQEPGGSVIEEFVSADEVKPESAQRLGALFEPPVLSAVGGDGWAPGGERPHLRLRFACPRPSCPYEAQRGDDFWHDLTKTLARMVAAGMRAMTVTEIDRSPWRVVRPVVSP